MFILKPFFPVKYFLWNEVVSEKNVSENLPNNPQNKQENTECMRSEVTLCLPWKLAKMGFEPGYGGIFFLTLCFICFRTRDNTKLSLRMPHKHLRKSRATSPNSQGLVNYISLSTTRHFRSLRAHSLPIEPYRSVKQGRCCWTQKNAVSIWHEGDATLTMTTTSTYSRHYKVSLHYQ